MKKVISQLVEKFESLIALRPFYTNEKRFSLYEIHKHSRDGNIIFDTPEKTDSDVELLFNQAVLSGGLIETYKGYTDETGNIHITNAPNLKLLTEDSTLFSRGDNFRLSRVVNNATVTIFYVEFQHAEKRELIGQKLGYPEIK